MAPSLMSEVIQHLRRAALLRDGAGLTDGQLLADYLSRRDEEALAALVHRHGPMVWGVCRRVLVNYHDAEDAFQATFLVFIRKAASIASRELLGNWLYAVAYQTALNTRGTAAKRRARESQVTEMPEPEIVQQNFWHDLQPLLDQEVSRLPEKYRIPIVLCDLEGKTRKEAALQIGCPEGTVAGRLARARVMLAKRLARQGVMLSGGALAAVLAPSVVSASVPSLLLATTVKIASLVGMEQPMTAGLISVKVAALTETGVLPIWVSKLKATVSVVLLMGVLAAGGIAWEHSAEPLIVRESQEACSLERAEDSVPPARPEATKSVLGAPKAEGAAIEETRNDRLRIKLVAAQLDAEMDGGGSYLAGLVSIQMEVENLSANLVTFTMPSITIIGEGVTPNSFLFFQPEAQPGKPGANAETWTRELRARGTRTIDFNYRKTDRFDQVLIPGKDVRIELTFRHGAGDGLRLLTRKTTIANAQRH